MTDNIIDLAAERRRREEAAVPEVLIPFGPLALYAYQHFDTSEIAHLLDPDFDFDPTTGGAA